MLHGAELQLPLLSLLWGEEHQVLTEACKHDGALEGPALNRLPSCKRNLTLSSMSKMKSVSFSGLSLLEVLLWLVLLPLEAVMMSMILAAYGNHVGTTLMSVICAAIRSRVLSL